MKDIGSKIRDKRKEIGMSIRELSEKSDCAYGTVVNIEKGRGGTLGVVSKICEILNLKITLNDE